MNSITQSTETRRQSNGVKLTAVAFGAAALGFNVYLSARIHAVDGAAEIERVSLEREITQLEQRMALKDKVHTETVEMLKGELERTQKVASTQARGEAKRLNDSAAKTLADRQREQQEMLLGEVGAVRTVSDETRAGLETVRAEVSGVRGAMDETRRGLAETGDILVRTQDDLNDFSGRLDAQAVSLAELKRRGERETMPFTLSESKTRTKVGELQVRLKNANPSKNRYTVEILADDRLILQKDRYVNEPVALYVTGAERPYEFVVTKVEKGRVSGFLSRPAWRQMARN
ncbi:MAG: hypothetical protein R2748_04270 [Bryobacterales bacterium]